MSTLSFDCVKLGKLARGIAVRRGLDRWSGRSFDLDDLEQAALLEVLEHAESYDPERGEFDTWAAEVMRRGMCRYVRRNSSTVRVPEGAQLAEERSGTGRRREASIDAPGRYDDDSSLHDRLADDRDFDPDVSRAAGLVTPFAFVEALLVQKAGLDVDAALLASTFPGFAERLDADLGRLTPQHSLVIRELLRGQSEQEVADMVGVTRQRIWRIKNDAIERLRRMSLGHVCR